MGKTTGFLEYERVDAAAAEPEKRIRDFNEFHGALPQDEQQLQAARCMNCGVPFCQAGVKISGMVSGCPLHNLVPEINDLVCKGKWEAAYSRLSSTHGMPEFTSHVCPALCENACTCGLHTAPVSTKANEKAIIDYAYMHGLVKEPAPKIRTGKSVAVIGSGPAGLSCAQLLNRRGHSVTVFERSDRPGGLLRYGIPNMKLDKRIIDRRVKLLEEAGIEFRCGVNIGIDLTGEELLSSYDRVVLCCGASRPRDIQAPGRDAQGIYFAVDFLSEVSKRLMDLDYDSKKLISSDSFCFGSLKDKKVVVVGGGDTGNDCVGTAIRLGASDVVQLEMMPAPPSGRLPSNPWPEWPKVLKTDYGQEEALHKFGRDPRIYQTTVTAFLKDEKGKLKGVKTVSLRPEKDEKTGRMMMTPAEGTEKELEADIILIAAGFLGCESYIPESFDARISKDSYETSCSRVFTAGDMRQGPSLVVRAMAEGRQAAKAVDESLMGYSNL